MLRLKKTVQEYCQSSVTKPWHERTYDERVAHKMHFICQKYYDESTMQEWTE